MSTMIDKILSEVSLDPRVHDGIFKLEEEAHMTVLREYLVNHGIEEAAAVEFCNKVLEGKYPERQAYNKNGILVTFPTPEYKKKAIQAGTHFEENPMKGKSNLFQSPGGAGKKEEPAPAAPPAKGGDTKTQLPVSQAQSQAGADADAPTAAQPPPQTTAAPMSTPEPAQPVPQPAEPTELPPPAPKTPQEKEADKQAIKTMLKGDDYMLERVVEFVLYNGHPSLIEDLRRKL